jgi:hypothetical protein
MLVVLLTVFGVIPRISTIIPTFVMLRGINARASNMPLYMRRLAFTENSERGVILNWSAMFATITCFLFHSITSTVSYLL